MMYSKTTDEIIRELNDFIVKAKETAVLAQNDRTKLQIALPFYG